MTAVVFAVAFAWRFVPALPDAVAWPVRNAVEVARDVLAIERMVAYRLPAKPTAADRAKRDELRDAAHEAGMQTRLNPWALERLQLAAKQAGSDWKRPGLAGAAARERLEYLGQLHHMIAAPR